MYMISLARGVAGEVRSTLTGRTETHRHLRDRLAAAVLLSLAVDVLAALVMLMLERSRAGTQIRTYGQSLFWTTSQLLTVSSSAANPVTPLGRLVDVLLELWAITVVTATAGSFGAFFHRRSLERRGDPAGTRAEGLP
jgi:hypothetical protein